MGTPKGVMGILVGGGPAPGINGVISAATIEARNHNLEVIGFLNGYQHLMAGKTDSHEPLDIAKVSRIHYFGGSILGTSRANPTKSPELLDNVIKSLKTLNVKYLLTIGGDDTAFSAMQIQKRAGNDIHIAHVPKTIDNDLPLAANVPTFGFQTARHEGVHIVRNLMADSKTAAPRWYIVVAMGRKAGHLALAIGKAAGATLTVIPEEFGNRTVTFKEICDIVDGSILKRRSHQREHGVAILAEGLVEHMTEEHREEIFGGDGMDRDEHGHIKLDDVELGRKVRDEMRRRYKARGLKTAFINKNLGYELRCADPIPFDCEYTRDLGYGAVKFLLQEKSAAVINFEDGVMKPLMFNEILDPKSGRPRTRLVDVQGESFEVALKYMLRLNETDGANPASKEKLAAAANMSVSDFEKQFGYLMETQRVPPPKA